MPPYPYKSINFSEPLASHKKKFLQNREKLADDEPVSCFHAGKVLIRCGLFGGSRATALLFSGA